VRRDTFLPYAFTSHKVSALLRAAAGKEFLRLLFRIDRLSSSSVPGFIYTSDRREQREGVQLFVIIICKRENNLCRYLIHVAHACERNTWRRYARMIILAPRTWTKCNASRGLLLRHSLQTFNRLYFFLRAIKFV